MNAELTTLGSVEELRGPEQKWRQQKPDRVSGPGVGAPNRVKYISLLS